ncbi:MAG: hypothetical protein LBR88_08730 [Zoogloeaceae bacterium]|nr:hypothetical protein [Zoogloeaceae bacterium]
MKPPRLKRLPLKLRLLKLCLLKKLPRLKRLPLKLRLLKKPPRLKRLPLKLRLLKKPLLLKRLPLKPHPLPIKSQSGFAMLKKAGDFPLLFYMCAQHGRTPAGASPAARGLQRMSSWATASGSVKVGPNAKLPPGHWRGSSNGSGN